METTDPLPAPTVALNRVSRCHLHRYRCLRRPRCHWRRALRQGRQGRHPPTRREHRRHRRRQRRRQPPRRPRARHHWVSSELSEDDIKVFAVTQPGADPTPADILAHCRELLPQYMVPATSYSPTSSPRPRPRRSSGSNSPHTPSVAPPSTASSSHNTPTSTLIADERSPMTTTLRTPITQTDAGPAVASTGGSVRATR